MQPFNKYYPSDWDPSKGSVNKFVGKHPLGDRARKIDQGILIVRFELPYNIWCNGCGKHVGKGVRYNAEKKRIGNYYSTPIWSFRMKCHLCDNWIEIQTDPKNAQYVVVGGARQKVETWEPEDTETIRLKDEEEQRRLAEDALFKLEHTVKDERKAAESATVLERLQMLNEKQWADPYTHSQKMRKKFREEKKTLHLTKLKDDEILTRNGLSIPLLPESPEDDFMAKTTDFSDKVLEQAKKRKLEVSASSIFKRHSSSKSKKVSSSSALRQQLDKINNDKVAQLSAIVKINTKLKTDPFLKGTNDWSNGDGNGVVTIKDKSGGGGSQIVAVKKKNLRQSSDNNDTDNHHHNNENNTNDNGNNKEYDKPPIKVLSLVSSEYDEDD
ncbi:12458_t:CDS:2 [Ambispora gerdemannii]|uniref:12458_t:CDS:1 n=1 Tax=Ambispora gerdemannii TaxID=144530 RepID=A0A9N8VW22_9GLOM|nr:12458_t:CDS:2 [Ambispora gerdemannii]